MTEGGDPIDSLFAPVRRGAPKQAQQEVDSLFAPARRTASRAGATNSIQRRADALSRQYLETHKLDFADKIEDGFCDLAYENVLINRGGDEALSSFMQRARRKLDKASDPTTALMVLALLISDMCGSSGEDAASLDARFNERLAENQRPDGKLLLGSLFAEEVRKGKNKVQGRALVRHRALAFKFTSDLLRTPACTLERDHKQMIAWNMVQLNEVSYVVDLMHDPGALYEAGSAKHDEYIGLCSAGLYDSQKIFISNRKELQGAVPRPPWHIEACHLDMRSETQDRLGQGGFGEVYKATWEGINVAVKFMRGKTFSDYDVLNFVLEIALLARLSHPNVMRLWRGCVQVEDGKRNLLMVTELVEKGDLSMLLHNRRGTSLQEALTFPQSIWLSLGIARGMEYLHACKVLHLDLKSPNVLIDVSWDPKICDFGLAKISSTGIERYQTTIQGVSAVWAAPEMFDIQAGAMTKKADVYSFGILFFEVVSRQLPFQEIPQRSLPQAKWEGALPKTPQDMPEQCATLITSCCAQSPSSRPSMKGVVESICGIASAKDVDLTSVAMPAWKEREIPASDPESLKQFQGRRSELQDERERLAAQLVKARQQRFSMQEAHLGEGVALNALAEEDIDMLFHFPTDETAAMSPANLHLLHR